jgi:hypothetical protein
VTPGAGLWAPGVERVATGIVSVAAMAERLKLPRTHLTRKRPVGDVGVGGLSPRV